jgi:hypothetical protein
MIADLAGASFGLRHGINFDIAANRGDRSHDSCADCRDDGTATRGHEMTGHYLTTGVGNAVDFPSAHAAESVPRNSVSGMLPMVTSVPLIPDVTRFSWRGTRNRHNKPNTLCGVRAPAFQVRCWNYGGGCPRPAWNVTLSAKYLWKCQVYDTM